MKKRRIIFCTYSSIYSSVVLQELLESEYIEVAGIINSTRTLNPAYSHFYGAMQFIRKTGWWYSLYMLCITDGFSLLQSLQRLLKYRQTNYESIHKLAHARRIPVLDIADVNTQQGIEFIRQHLPDFILSAHFNQLFKADVINLPKIACLNIHPSLLPAYRGVDPVFYALLNNEDKLGVSLHIIDETFDTGNLLAQQTIQVQANTSVFKHNLALFLSGAKLSIEHIRHMETSENGIRQQGAANYDSWPTPSLVKQLKKQGWSLIRFKELLFLS